MFGIVQLTGDFCFVQIVPVALPNVYLTVYTLLDGMESFVIVRTLPNVVPPDSDGVDDVAAVPILILDTFVALSRAALVGAPLFL